MAARALKDSAITIKILKWEEHNPRKDYKTPRWFALNNRLVEDEDFFDFTAEEFKAWIYILSKASQKGVGEVSLKPKHAEQVSNISPSALNSALLKLEQSGQIQLVTNTRTESVQIRTESVQITNESVQNLYATGQDNTEHNITNITEHTLVGLAPDDPAISPDGLASLWNELVGNELPKCMEIKNNRLKKARTRLSQNNRRSFWVSVIERIKASDFCCGRSATSDWRASFDWLLHPATANKILEGTYDNRKAPRSRSNKAAPVGGHQRETDPQAEIDLIMSEV